VLNKIYRVNELASTTIPIMSYKDNREVVNAELIDNSKDIKVSIMEIEEAVIHRVIRNNNLQNELSRIVRLLKREEKLDIYTDGLLV
ncbi:190_t:CDS:1, partial [Scutellospora calospora]